FLQVGFSPIPLSPCHASAALAAETALPGRRGHTRRHVSRDTYPASPLVGGQGTIAFTCPRFEDEPALARRPRQGVRRPRLRAPPRGRGGRGESHHRDTTRAGAARPTPDFPPTDVAQAISRALQASAAQQLTRCGSGAEPRMCALMPRAKKKQLTPAPWRAPVRFGRSSPGWRWCLVCSMPPVSGAFPAPHSPTRPQLGRNGAATGL